MTAALFRLLTWYIQRHGKPFWRSFWAIIESVDLVNRGYPASICEYGPDMYICMFQIHCTADWLGQF